MTAATLLPLDFAAGEPQLDTRFRAGLRRLAERGRLSLRGESTAIELEIAGMMKRLDGGPALVFERPYSAETGRAYEVPVVANLLANQANCEAAFGVDARAIRSFVGRALGAPVAPAIVDRAPAYERVVRDGIDVGAALPVLRHTPDDGGRYVTAGVIVVRDPESGVYNASYHRLKLIGPDRAAIQLDYGRHLRLAFERAQRRGEALSIAVCLGTDLALHYTAATMGSQMPEDADELAVAGGLAGRPLPVVRALTQDLLVPAESEIVLEGRILPDETAHEGPFGEFVGSLSTPGPAPVVAFTALATRERPIYHAIRRETIALRKYVLEASLLNVLQAAVPIVVDAEMTAGGLHRFHAVIAVRKRSQQHEGFQRNAIMAAFGALKDLDLAIVVDDDIDIRDPADVEYALATRMEASRDLIVVPAARGHEYVRAGDRGVRAKLGIDATVPFDQRERFARCTYAPVEPTGFSSDVAEVLAALER